MSPQKTAVIIAFEIHQTAESKTQEDNISHIPPLESHHRIPPHQRHPHVMQMLGHRDIKTTLIYTQLVNIIAEAASKTEDIRIAFSILLTAALIAEKHGKTKIETEDSETRLNRIKDLRVRIKELKAYLKRRGM